MVENEDNDNGHDKHDGHPLEIILDGVPYQQVDDGIGYVLDAVPASKPQSRTSFLNGIHRDVNAYKDFKEDKYYDSWIKSVKGHTPWSSSSIRQRLHA